jgi:N-glycosidase YbiA
MNEPIYFYTKTMPYWDLSNFSPPGIEVDGVYWPTVEHYFQAEKFTDPDMREKVRRMLTPKEARALGQTRSVAIRTDWDIVRESVMLEALRIKFKQPAAHALLLSTGNRMLVESSPFDCYWAAGKDGSGLNRLGHLLAQVRTELAGLSASVNGTDRPTKDMSA